MRSTTTYEFLAITGAKNNGIAGILSEMFLSCGVLPQDIIESRIDGQLSVSSFFKSRSEAVQLKKRIDRLNLRAVNMKIRSMRSEDWQNKWKEDFKPFRLTDEIDISPVWHKKAYRSKRRIIYIDTVLAFGTGLHETTRFMSELIRQMRGEFSTFLDVGTGTGILSMVAKFYGAEKIVGLDIDAPCVAVAKKNLAANHLKFNKLVACDIADYKDEPYDFVAANLISQDLIRFKKKLISLVKKGKYLAVSGISLENLPKLRKEFAKLPLRCLRVKKGKKWSAVLYRRSR